MLQILIRIPVWESLMSMIRRGNKSFSAKSRWPLRYVYTAIGCFALTFSFRKAFSAAIKWDDSGVGYFCLANWALRLLI